VDILPNKYYRTSRWANPEKIPAFSALCVTRFYGKYFLVHQGEYFLLLDGLAYAV